MAAISRYTILIGSLMILGYLVPKVFLENSTTRDYISFVLIIAVLILMNWEYFRAYNRLPEEDKE